MISPNGPAMPWANMAIVGVSYSKQRPFGFVSAWENPVQYVVQAQTLYASQRISPSPLRHTCMEPPRKPKAKLPGLKLVIHSARSIHGTKFVVVWAILRGGGCARFAQNRGFWSVQVGGDSMLVRLYGGFHACLPLAPRVTLIHAPHRAGLEPAPRCRQSPHTQHAPAPLGGRNGSGASARDRGAICCGVESCVFGHLRGLIVEGSRLPILVAVRSKAAFQAACVLECYGLAFLD